MSQSSALGEIAMQEIVLHVGDATDHYALQVNPGTRRAAELPFYRERLAGRPGPALRIVSCALPSQLLQARRRHRKTWDVRETTQSIERGMTWGVRKQRERC